MARKPKKPIDVATLKHAAAKRTNIPTAELESVMAEADKAPIRLAWERRNRDLDPRLVCRGKDAKGRSDPIVEIEAEFHRLIEGIVPEAAPA